MNLLKIQMLSFRILISIFLSFCFSDFYLTFLYLSDLISVLQCICVRCSWMFDIETLLRFYFEFDKVEWFVKEKQANQMNRMAFIYQRYD